MKQESSRSNLLVAAVLVWLSMAATVDAFSVRGPPVSRPRQQQQQQLVHHSSSSARAPAASSSTTCLSSTSTDDVPLQVARGVQPSVALVTPIGVRNSTTRGSGFVVDFDEGTDNKDQQQPYVHLLTAAHVAAPGYQIQVSFPTSDTTVPATVIGRNETLDLALIRTTLPDADVLLPPPPLEIATQVPETGSYAFAHGFPASRLRGPAMTAGIVCGIADGLGVPDNEGQQQQKNCTRGNFYQSTSFVVTDAAMSGGMSGGPLCNSKGIVIGVNALIRPDLRALGNYAVSCEEIHSFLEHTKANAAASTTDDDATNDEAKEGTSTFQVYLYNDPMNKRERVSRVLQDIAKLGEEDATRVMMEAHTTGKSCVAALEDRDAAEELVTSLRREGDVLVEVVVATKATKEEPEA